MEMSRKEQQIPAIRFNGFTDAWEQRKLGEFADISTGKLDANAMVEDGEYDFYTSGMKKYRIDTPAFEGPAITIAGNGATVGYMHLADGEFNAYQRTYVLQNFQANRYFLYSEISKKLPRKIAQEARTGNIPYIVMDMLTELTISLPVLEEEQAKIGAFFKQLDNTIALHQRQLDNCKALKKVMLQKIFNQELRFKDQEGNNYPDWEKIALNELGETYTGLSGKTKENFGKGKGRFVTYMNVYSNPIADLAMTENVEIKDGENQNEVCYGDIFFTTSSETPEEVGMSSVWLSHESKVYLNSFCFGYRLSSQSEGVISPDFLGFQLRAPHIRKKIIFLAQGSTRFNISKSKLMDIVVYMPTIEEQNKITAFLLNVDSKIKHTIQSIERLNMLKKALLQQMFI